MCVAQPRPGVHSAATTEATKLLSMLRGTSELRHVRLQAGDRYLEVGCGTGRHAIQLARSHELAVTGVDINPAHVNRATARARNTREIRFVTGDCAALPFADDEFDIVTTSHLLHHVPQWQSAIQELIRMLAVGGCLALSDIVLPARAATIARAITGPRIRFLTRFELETALADGGRTAVHVSQSRFSLAGTYIKPSSSSPATRAI